MKTTDEQVKNAFATQTGDEGEPILPMDDTVIVITQWISKDRTVLCMHVEGKEPQLSEQKRYECQDTPSWFQTCTRYAHEMIRTTNGPGLAILEAQSGNKWKIAALQKKLKKTKQEQYESMSKYRIEEDHYEKQLKIIKDEIKALKSLDKAKPQ